MPHRRLSRATAYLCLLRLLERALNLGVEVLPLLGFGYVLERILRALAEYLDLLRLVHPVAGIELRLRVELLGNRQQESGARHLGFAALEDGLRPGGIIGRAGRAAGC